MCKTSFFHFFSHEVLLPASMASHLSLCSIGAFLNDVCGQDTDRKSFSEFTIDEKKLLILRCGVKSIDSVCRHHERMYLGQFVGKERFCCDPFNKHKKKVQGKG